MVLLRFRFDKARAFRRVCEKWKRDLKDLRWAWPVIGEALAVYHTKVFDTEGAQNLSGGGKWAPLAERTIQMRIYGARVSKVPNYDYEASSTEGPAERVLHWSHRLRDAMTSKQGTGDSLRRGTARSFEYGVQGIAYAPKHQSGGTSEQGYSIPARPFLDIAGGPFLAINLLGIALQARMAGGG